jgi:UDP-2,3-diacylglucosamine hydrolase
MSAAAKSSDPGAHVNSGPLGIVCGAGTFPIAVAEAVQRRGRPVVLLALRGFADPSVERFPHEWMPFGAFGTSVKLARKHGVHDLVVIGSVLRPKLLDFRLDWTTFRILPRLARLYRGGDDHLLSGVASLLDDYGFHLMGVHEVAPELMIPAGVLGAHRPSAEDETDIALGFDLLRALGPFDVGQAAAISARRVLGVEAAEGTAGLLGRLAEMRNSGRLMLPARAGVLVKAPKPGQSRRIDVPAIGAETVTQAAAAGLRGIAVEAGGTIVPDANAMVRAADQAGLFLIGVPAAREGRR